MARRLNRFAAFEAAVGLKPRHSRQRSDSAAQGADSTFGSFHAEAVSAQSSTVSGRSDSEAGSEALPLSSAAKARSWPCLGLLGLGRLWVCS